MDGPALSLPTSIALPSFLARKTTKQRLSGDCASSAVTRTAAGFHCLPILCRPQDRYAFKKGQ